MYFMAQLAKVVWAGWGLLTALTAVSVGVAGELGGKKEILIIYSFHESLPWYRGVRDSLVNKLSDLPDPPVVFEEYMDFARFSGAAQRNLFEEFLERKYADKQLDLVVIESGAASVYFSTRPDLLAGRQRMYVNPTENVAARIRAGEVDGLVTSVPDITSAFEHMVDVADPENVFVVGETVTHEIHQMVDVLRTRYPKKIDSRPVTYLLNLSMDDLLHRVDSLPPHSAIFYLLMFHDGAGRRFLPGFALQRIISRANAPVFTHWDSLLGSGAVGGYILNGRKAAYAAADAIAEYLSTGTYARAPKDVFDYAYDWRALDRYGISMARLPANSRIFNRAPSFWDRHGDQVAAFLFIVCVLITLSAVWIVTLRRKVREKTVELVSARDDLQRQIDIIDRYVLVAAVDTDGSIRHASEAFEKRLGYAKKDLLGAAHRDFWAAEGREAEYEGVLDAVKQGRSWSGEIRLRTRDGGECWVTSDIAPDLDAEGAVRGYTAIHQDISDKKRLEELSITDGLTGLRNRLKIDAVLTREIDRARRYGQNLSAIILDIDHFKTVNDAYGHQAGDVVLVGIAETIRANVRATDVAGRWGGEEFVVICPETDRKSAEKLAEKLRCAVAERDSSPAGSVTASFGVTAYRQGDDPAAIMARADKALYRAKALGRNRVAVAA